MLPLFDNNIAAVQNAIQQRVAAHQAAMTNNSANDDADFNTLLAAVKNDRAAQQAPVASPTATNMPQAAIGRKLGMPAPQHASNLPMPKGSVANWIAQALGTMHLDKSFAPGIAQLIQHESGGNPNAINNWDSNAKAGHPSQGLMQTIPGTFNEYALPGHNKILNPVDNIIAGTRYALKNYGAGMLKSGGRHNSSGGYIGY